MCFSYESYGSLLKLLKEYGYQQTNYWDYGNVNKPVILRHDIDTDLSQALKMAEYEMEMGAVSTYFVLLRTDFYNPASFYGQKTLQNIHSLGHEIGLHFDESFYGDSLSNQQLVDFINTEAQMLSNICEFPIRTVSMHRPSQKILSANLEIPGIRNSYSEEFFHKFKYLSDSRRRWREPVKEIIKSGVYNMLHILTHPFWYHDTDESLETSVREFISSANFERYEQLSNNISDLQSIVRREEFL